MTAVTHQLRYPITTQYTVRGEEPRVETVTEITLRRPNAKDMLATDNAHGDMAKSLIMIQRLSGLDSFQVEKIDIADMMEIGSIIEGFTEPGLPTGKTP